MGRLEGILRGGWWLLIGTLSIASSRNRRSRTSCVRAYSCYILARCVYNVHPLLVCRLWHVCRGKATSLLQSLYKQLENRNSTYRCMQCNSRVLNSVVVVNQNLSNCIPTKEHTPRNKITVTILKRLFLI